MTIYILYPSGQLPVPDPSHASSQHFAYLISLPDKQTWGQHGHGRNQTPVNNFLRQYRYTLLPERGKVLQAARRALEGGPEGGYLDMCPVLSGVHDLHISSYHSDTPVFVD